MTAPGTTSVENDIAIVGMAGRFPGAADVRAFWRNLAAGVESVRPIARADLLRIGVSPSWVDDPLYIKAAAPLEDVDRFDAEFFNLSPREAAIMDPQHRHFLECAWEALEDAGHVPEYFEGAIGVFAGCGMQAYFNYHLLPNIELMRSTGLFLVRHTGNDKDFLTTRASYILDLKGPSVSIQSACSTSLVAIHVACQSLLSYQCDLALAGGVTIELPQGLGYRYEEGGILSPDGHCRAFDAQALGTVFGSGVGIVVLRRLSDALADRDHIVAVVKGSAVNNDGAGKVGYFAPSFEGQAAAVHEALSVAGVEASSVSYVEAHGTGTPLGDAIEIGALTEAFRRHTNRTGYCALGSVKTNIGHLDTAAGAAGFIKTALALERELIPPSLNFEAPNPRFDLPSTPFVVNTELRAWPRSATPRRAAVNSLGVGGTNAHVVLEEAPELPSRVAASTAQVLLISARTAAALDRTSLRLAEALEEAPALPLADVAYTLQVGRRSFAHRRAVVCRTTSEAAGLLKRPDAGRRQVASRHGRTPPVVLMFPGGGAQYYGMGSDLYRDEPVYRERLDECRVVARRLGIAAVERLPIGPVAGDPTTGAAMLARPAASILSVFITEYALAHLWMSWGVEPAALMGHSAGEYMAAHLAGVFSLEDALRIVAVRGRIFEELDPGAMLSVGVSEEELRGHLPEGVEIAAINGPSACVVSGRAASVATFEAELTSREWPWSRLHIDVAAHSSMLDPYLDRFEREISDVRFERPRRTLVANLTGAQAGDEVATPAYWRRHLREAVRFSAGVDHLLVTLDQPVLLETGPGHSLTGLVRARLGGESARASAVASMRHPKDIETDHEAIARAHGELWLAGVALRWESRHHGQARRVSLPGYAFERARHWIDAPLPVWLSGQALAAAAADSDTSFFEGRDWIYAPQWRPLANGQTFPAASGTPRCLVFARPDDADSRAVAQALAALHANVRLVYPGSSFVARESHYEIAPGDPAALRALLDECRRTGFEPTHVVHAWLWSVPAPSRELALEQWMAEGFETLLGLVQAHQALSGRPLSLTVLTRRGWTVADEGVSTPEAALALGPVLTAAREYAAVSARILDSDDPPDPARVASLALTPERLSPVVALRHGRAFERRLAQVVPEPSSQTPLKKGGVYLITGGLGGIAGVLAARLATEFRATLVLVGRTKLPPREEWASVLRMASVTPIARRVRRLRALEATGARVTYYSADAGDVGAMRRIVAETAESFGGLDGIFHTAGSIDDGAIALKTVERARRVVLAKAAGAVALDEATSDAPPPLFVVFSSTSAWLGLEGQVDYTSANAYLDAFAEWRSRARPGRTLSVGWGAWRDVGMASRALGLEDDPLEPAGAEAAGHPLLGQLVIDEPGQLVFESTFKTGDRWELHEHRLASGQAVLPGTAFVDMLWAAASRALGTPVVELRDVVFQAPFVALDDVAYLVRTVLRRQGEGWSAQVDSTVAGESGVLRTEHVRALLEAGSVIGATQSMAQVPQGPMDNGFSPTSGLNPRQAEHVLFGDRWKVLTHAARTAGVMVGHVALAPGYRSDLLVPRIHPALLDIATTVGIPLLEEPQSGVFVPFSYGRILLTGPLPAEFDVWARPAVPLGGSSETASFEVTAVDAEGRVVLEVRDFVMRLVNPAVFSGAIATHPEETPELARLRQWVARGIPSSVGADLLLRLIASDTRPEIVVTPIPFEELSSESTARVEVEARGDVPTSREGVTRVVAELWQELLGVSTVGPEDDFFDLGGHSLIAVRLVSRLERKLGVRLSLSTLFQARTPRAIAELVTEDRESRWTSLVAVQGGGDRPAFYCAHPLGGEVLGYRRLAAAMGADQPFWGFRSRGHEGEFEPLWTIEEQAALYVADLIEREPTGPYYLGGYSHGGRVAFEMSRQLHAQGRRVALLAIIDTWPRQRLSRSASQLGAWLGNLPGWLRHEVAKNELWRNRQELERSIKRIRRYLSVKLHGRPIPPDISEEMNVDHLPEHIRRTIQANFTAFTSYEPGSYDGPVVLFRASAQPLASPATRDLGWRRFVTGELRVRDLTGTHRQLTKDPLVAELGKALREELDRARAVVEATPSTVRD